MPVFNVHSHRRYVVELKSTGTLTQADDKDFATIPFTAGHLVGGVCSVRTNGDTSGSTDFTFERHRDGSATDMLAAAVSIAHDSSENHVDIEGGDLSTTVEATKVRQGDQIGLNIDAIPGGTASADASVSLVFHIDQE